MPITGTERIKGACKLWEARTGPLMFYWERGEGGGINSLLEAVCGPEMVPHATAVMSR